MLRSITLPIAPPSIKAKLEASNFSFDESFFSQRKIKMLTLMAKAVKNQRCQPPALLKKLNAAPLLKVKVKLKNGKKVCGS